MTADQVYRHSIFDRDYNVQAQKGYEGRAKVGFKSTGTTDRKGTKIL